MFALIVAVASIGAFALTKRAERNADGSKVSPSQSGLSTLKATLIQGASKNRAFTESHPSPTETVFGQFPAYTEAERELEKILRGKDEDIDLALVNWLIAADVPEFRNVTRAAYFAQLGRHDRASAAGHGQYGKGRRIPT